jgi:sulfur-carrier protein
MKTKIHYLGLVKTYTNKTEDTIELPEAAHLSDLLNKLAKEFGKQFTQDIYEPNAKDVKTNFSITVNGVFIGQLDGLNTKLKDGDLVILMPLVTGG